MTTRKRTRKKARQNVVYGRVYVQSTFNNTVVTITDRSGSVLAWNSGGTEEFKGSKKSTAFAAQLAAQLSSRRAN